MSKLEYLPFLFVKDVTESGGDQFFVLQGNKAVKVDALYLVKEKRSLICQDFWQVRDVIFSLTGKLPKVTIDLDELMAATSGNPKDRKSRDKTETTPKLAQFGMNEENLAKYKKIIDRQCPADLEVLSIAMKALVGLKDHLFDVASANDELDRFLQIEVPSSHVLQSSAAYGISIDPVKVAAYRKSCEHKYFIALKNFSAKHDMPLEVPSDFALEKTLEERGYNFSGVTIDYLLSFITHPDGFGEDVLELRRLSRTRKMLTDLTLSLDKVHPMVDIFGSRTSRIFLKDPLFQHIPRRFRDVIVAEKDKGLSYVDYDQYEAGIMAVMSQDDEMLKLFKNGDMYGRFAKEFLGDLVDRKTAKRLFLSYAYGMKRQSLVDAAVSFGVERVIAKTAFRKFEIYENWKLKLAEEFKSKGKIGTSLGNYLIREKSGQLSAKERRSVVSQVVQGTASLIFKKAIIEVDKIGDVRILIPMHDAVLFEHGKPETPELVVACFEKTMTDFFDGAIKGKASLSDYIE